MRMSTNTIGANRRNCTFWLLTPDATKRYPQYSHENSWGRWLLYRGMRGWKLSLTIARCVMPVRGGPWRSLNEARGDAKSLVQGWPFGLDAQ